VAGDRSDLALAARFPGVWRVWRALPAEDAGAIAECLRTLAGGMRRYATRAAGRPAGVPYLDSEAELHDYCWVVAGCVGVMLTRLFTLRDPDTRPDLAARRLGLAPAVGEALQLTNILLDWPADVRRGRCHVPAEWLAGRGLTPADLVREERPEVREIAEHMESLARDALARVPEYLALVPARHVRYRLFCLWPALWAEASLRHARRDPSFPWGPSRPRLPKRELWTTALRGFVIGGGGQALAR
jgi:farnesyl-diphosphate farnesyltransferase